jgi:hypothetical protein
VNATGDDTALTAALETVGGNAAVIKITGTTAAKTLLESGGAYKVEVTGINTPLSTDALFGHV